MNAVACTGEWWVLVAAHSPNPFARRRWHRDRVAAWIFDEDGSAEAMIADVGPAIQRASLVWPGRTLSLVGPGEWPECDCAEPSPTELDGAWCAACTGEIPGDQAAAAA